jgi:hypothetical protein
MIEKLAMAFDVDPHQLALLLETTVKKTVGEVRDDEATRLVVSACLILIKQALEQETKVIKLFAAKQWLENMQKSGNAPVIALNPVTVANWANTLGSQPIHNLTRIGHQFYNDQGIVALDGPIGDLMLEGYALIANVLTSIELAALSTVAPGGHA